MGDNTISNNLVSGNLICVHFVVVQDAHIIHNHFHTCGNGQTGMIQAEGPQGIAVHFIQFQNHVVPSGLQVCKHILNLFFMYTAVVVEIPTVLGNQVHRSVAGVDTGQSGSIRNIQIEGQIFTAQEAHSIGGFVIFHIHGQFQTGTAIEGDFISTVAFFYIGGFHRGSRHIAAKSTKTNTVGGIHIAELFIHRNQFASNIFSGLEFVVVGDHTLLGIGQGIVSGAGAIYSGHIVCGQSFGQSGDLSDHSIRGRFIGSGLQFGNFCLSGFQFRQVSYQSFLGIGQVSVRNPSRSYCGFVAQGYRIRQSSDFIDNHLSGIRIGTQGVDLGLGRSHQGGIGQDVIGITAGYGSQSGSSSVHIGFVSQGDVIHSGKFPDGDGCGLGQIPFVVFGFAFIREHNQIIDSHFGAVQGFVIYHIDTTTAEIFGIERRIAPADGQGETVPALCQGRRGLQGTLEVHNGTAIVPIGSRTNVKAGIGDFGRVDIFAHIQVKRHVFGSGSINVFPSTDAVGMEEEEELIAGDGGGIGVGALQTFGGVHPAFAGLLGTFISQTTVGFFHSQPFDVVNFYGSCFVIGFADVNDIGVADGIGFCCNSTGSITVSCNLNICIFCNYNITLHFSRNSFDCTFNLIFI